MATQQRTRTSRKSNPQSTASDRTDIPLITFVGEQIVYRDRDVRIAEAAYLRAQSRGFVPGHELDDWLAAEKEIDELLSGAHHRDAQSR